MRIRGALLKDNCGMRESLAGQVNRAPTLRCVGARPGGEEAFNPMPAEITINLP